MVSLAASIDPADLLRAGIDPVATIPELSAWVAHAYAGDATGSAGGPAPIPAALASQPGRSTGKNTSARSRRSVTAASSPSGPIPRRIRPSGLPRLLSGSNGSARKGVGGGNRPNAAARGA